MDFLKERKIVRGAYFIACTLVVFWVVITGFYFPDKLTTPILLSTTIFMVILKFLILGYYKKYE
jgi:hypothetical protein